MINRGFKNRKYGNFQNVEKICPVFRLKSVKNLHFPCFAKIVKFKISNKSDLNFNIQVITCAECCTQNGTA